MSGLGSTLGSARLQGGSPERRMLLVSLALALVNVAFAVCLGALATVQPVIGVGIGLAAVVAIAILLRPDAATLLFLALLYSNAGAIGVQLHGLPFIVAAAFPALLLLPLAHHLILRGEPPVMTPALRLVAALFLWQLISTLLSRDVGSAFETLLVFAVEGVLLVALVTNVIRDSEGIRRATWVLLLVGAGAGLLSLIQQLTGDFSQTFLGFAQVSRAVINTGDLTVIGQVEQPRLAGMIGEKNKYAQVLIVLLPLAWFRIRDERAPWLRLLAVGCAALIAAGTALSFSRGAGLGFVAVVAVMLVLRYVHIRQLVPIVVAAALLLAAFPTYADRLFSLAEVAEVDQRTGGADPSIESRLTENIAAVLAIADHPVLGTGPGLFPSYYRRYADEVAIRVQHADREAHNLYLGEAAEGGIPGLLLFLAIFGVLFRDLEGQRRRWLEARPDLAGFAAAFILALVAYLATGIFLHLAYERYLWILIALAAVTVHVAQRTDEAEPPPGWVTAPGAAAGSSSAVRVPGPAPSAVTPKDGHRAGT